MNTTLVTLVIYFALMLFIAWRVSRNETLEAYFLNNRRTGQWFLTFSNIASLFGAGATVVAVSEIYNSGISFGLAYLVSYGVGMFILGIMAKRIKKVGDEYNAYSIVDFFEKRFDRKNRNLAGTLQMFLIVMWLAVQTSAIAGLASVLIGVDYRLAIILSAGITVAYTAIGGLRADIFTDVIQFWIILITFALVGVFSYVHVGGIGSLVSKLPAGHLNPFAFGGFVWFFGTVLGSGFLLTADATCWQKIFSSKNEKVARNSYWWSLPILVLLSVLVLFFGLAASVLFPGISQNTAIYSLIGGVLPPWMAGLGFAAMLAVIMSTADSLVIGGSTIAYKAILKKEHTGTRRDVLYARIITALLGIFGGLIAFLVPSVVRIFLFTLYLSLLFIPAIIAGLYTKKVSANASFFSLLIPFIILAVLFPNFAKDSVVPALVSSVCAIAIILFYDKIIKRGEAREI